MALSLSGATPIRLGRTWYFSDGIRLPVVSGGAGDEGETFEMGQLSDDDLSTLESQIAEELDDLYPADGDPPDDPAAEQRIDSLVTDLETVRAEIGRRDEERSERRARLASRVAGVRGNGDDEPDEPGEPDPPPPPPTTAAVTIPATDSLRRSSLNVRLRNLRRDEE